MGLVELPLTPPPMFVQACGYRGNARHVALCWIPEDGVLWLSDDGNVVLGEPRALVLMAEHPATAPALENYTEANACWAIRPWLLVDRSRRTLGFGDPATVWQTIAQSEHGPHTRRAPVPDPLVIDPRRQRWLEHRVSTWLDWVAQRERGC
jgi:hypothetical protein